MDECVRLEEALQAEEERSPRPRPARRSSRWPFSFEDFGKTDEIRLPTVSPGLAALSPGPPEPSPRRRATNPSSPHIWQRSDDRNDPSQSAAQSPKTQAEITVERVSSPTKSKPREKRRVIYSKPTTSKDRDRRSEITLQSPTLPRAFSLTDLGGSQDGRNSHRHYGPSISPRTRNNTPKNREEERPACPEDVAPAADRAPSVVPEPRPLQIPEIVAILRGKETAGLVRESSPQKLRNPDVKFRAVCKAWVLVKLNTDPPRHKILVMIEIGTVFPTIRDLNLYQVRTNFSYKADYPVLGPRIFKRDQYSLNKGDPETEGEKEFKMEIENDAESTFTLKQNKFKSREIVIHVALLLDSGQRETLKPFHAGFRLSVSSGTVDRMLELGGEREDIKLLFEPERSGEHREHLVPKDLNLHELLRNWVKSG